MAVANFLLSNFEMALWDRETSPTSCFHFIHKEPKFAFEIIGRFSCANFRSLPESIS